MNRKYDTQRLDSVNYIASVDKLSKGRFQKLNVKKNDKIFPL